MSVLESNSGMFIVCLLRDGRMFYVCSLGGVEAAVMTQ